MDLTQQLLGQPLDAITLDNVQTYFQEPRIESDIIEYKSYALPHQNNPKHKENAVIKTVCAMLNAEGGVIIWGAPVEYKNPDTGIKIYQGRLSLIDHIVIKDHLLSKIYQSIYPLPQGIKLEVLTDENNNSLCIFEVQKSSNSIHRFDERYWIRLDGQTHVAPHHYVEAIIKQVRFPNIEGYLRVVEYKQEPWIQDDISFNFGTLYHWIGIRYFIFNWSGLINEEDVSFNIMTEKGQFSGDRHGSSDYLLNGKMYRPKKIHSILYYGEPIMDAIYILIDPSEIQEPFVFHIYFTIGGRKSPLKRSEYEIHIDRSVPEIPNRGFKIIAENELIVDLHTELEMTKEELLNYFLER